MKKIKRIFCISLVLFLLPLMLLFMMMGGEGQTSYGSNANFTGEYTPDLPLFPEIKGTGNIPDIVAQMAVGTAVKYRLLPSVILSQWAYESAWGKSTPATSDNNFFGITWFTNCGFPQGTPRGVGGSEGGNYMKFDSMSANFSYYGYMVAKQPNFNACVGNTSPSECLLILGRGGYAAAGITENSAYYKACLGIIESNNLTSYDDFAIKNWGSDQSSSGSLGSGKGNVSIIESKLGVALYGGECYGLTGYYVDQLGGPKLMGSGFMNASDIGKDYNWIAYGYEVKFNPKFSDVQAGDIVNFSAGYGFAVPYGHTGIAKSSTDTSVTVYDQWQGHGVTVSTYSRPLTSIVRKVK